MVKAIGNTYSVKEQLKQVGFSFDADSKSWLAITFDKTKWETKFCNATYAGRKVARECSEIKFKDIDFSA